MSETQVHEVDEWVVRKAAVNAGPSSPEAQAVDALDAARAAGHLARIVEMDGRDGSRTLIVVTERGPEAST